MRYTFFRCDLLAHSITGQVNHLQKPQRTDAYLTGGAARRSARRLELGVRRATAGAVADRVHLWGERHGECKQSVEFGSMLWKCGLVMHSGILSMAQVIGPMPASVCTAGSRISVEWDCSLQGSMAMAALTRAPVERP